MAERPFSSQKKGGVSARDIVRPLSLAAPYFDSGDIRRQLSTVESKVTSTKFDRVRHKDTKRSHIALVFVYGYMAMVALTVIGAPVYNALVLQEPEAIDLERILAQVGALVGAPLGFVIGYYFKEDK